MKYSNITRHLCWAICIGIVREAMYVLYHDYRSISRWNIISFHNKSKQYRHSHSQLLALVISNLKVVKIILRVCIILVNWSKLFYELEGIIAEWYYLLFHFIFMFMDFTVPDIFESQFSPLWYDCRTNYLKYINAGSYMLWLEPPVSFGPHTQ